MSYFISLVSHTLATRATCAQMREKFIFPWLFICLFLEGGHQTPLLSLEAEGLHNLTNGSSEGVLKWSQSLTLVPNLAGGGGDLKR